ncbi:MULTISPECIES: hypothetical protein [Tenacibaculum]|uniref:hypothetical protein n=1 Tax=Tenacibaculum TaxID=104267 RepID=UPI0008959131|nr:hypothetical protein [Tenacibaculum sp. MAR_2010_89]SED53349.1 hypothetical protein SAMN04487765_0279 [Tenacibaculum sp. MAR_2010_89]
MAQVNILAAVNVAAAIKSGNLGEYVFMMDTNDYMGTGNKSEGTDELHTLVTNGDTIVWSVVSIDPNLSISIHSFHGEAINEGLIKPAQYPQHDGAVWGGHVNSAGTNVQYTMTLLVNGKLMTFDPFITSVNPN